MDHHGLTRYQGAVGELFTRMLALGLRPLGFRKDGSPIWPIAGGENLTEVNLDTFRSVEELTNFEKNVRSRLEEIDKEHEGLPLPDPARAEFAALTDVRTKTTDRIKELTARQSYIRSMAEGGSDGRRTETLDLAPTRSAPNMIVKRDADIWDLSTVRSNAFSNPEGMKQELRDRAMRAVELARFPHTDRQRAQTHAAELLDYADDPTGRVARLMLTTGSPTYNRSFWKSLAGQSLNGEEQRALSLTGASGGFAVPFELDPTIIPTSNSSVNPFRAIARVIPIPGDEWRGVSSGAITASYAAEATETTDNSPTLAQPTISTEKAQAFIPFSIEVGMDWGGLQVEMGRLLAESKDDLEATKFTTGTGTNEPFGLITGATNTVAAATGQTFTVANLYSLEAALPPRYRPRASLMGNRAIFQLTRQFDTAGGANLWLRLGEGLPNNPDGRLGYGLLGYPTYEDSAMTGTTATGVKFLVIGDFSRYVIVDRIGLTVELIPHLFGTTANYPSGQRGLYAYWRNGAKVVDANAFRVLIGTA